MAEPLTSDDPRQVASYQVRARLGAGGMGQVYLAITPAGRRVALKMVRAEYGDDERFRARFRQEVSAAQRVHGLFTAQVLDADPDAPQPWLATSYVPGLSLRQAVIEFGPLPPASVVLLIAGIAEALQAIHAAGVVHRDLKPANVILAADGPRVIDFGIAQAAAAPSLTQGGSRVGSPRFMAPEQARSQATTPAVDVFALGSLATYACAGHPPFGSDHALAVLGRVLHDPPDLDGCPPELRGLIGRCLDKDPGRRPLPGDIIETCQTMAGGALSFERPWLPGAVSAAAAAEFIVGPPASAPGAGPAAQGKPGRAGLEPAGPEWTMASEASRDAAWAADPGTGSGPIRDPAEPVAPAPGAPVPLAGTGLAKRDLGGGAAQLAAESGPGAAGPGAAGPGAAGPGAAGPGAAGPGEAPAGLHRRPGKTAAAVAGAAALVLVAAAASVATLASSESHAPTAGQHGQHTGALPSDAPSLRAKVRRPMIRGATPAPPGRPSVIPSTTAQVTRPRSSPSHRADASPTSPRKSSPAPKPAAPSPSPTPSPTSPPTDQAAFGGTWDGIVLQPGWTAPTWELQLDIPADGRWGSYSAPSLGCSGTVRVTGISGGTMTAKAKTTSPVYSGCVKSARLIIAQGALGDLDLTWTPGNGRKLTGTAVLVSS